MSKPGTKDRALRIGEALLQRNGYSGFSFQDIADELKIRKPSLYDHFESKEALGNAVIDGYASRFSSWLENVRTKKPRERLVLYFHLLYDFSKSGKLCPASALSGNLETLPASLRKNLLRFSGMLNEWVVATIHEGQREDAFRNDLGAEALARTFLSAAIGGQTIARLGQKPATLKKLCDEVLKLIEK